MKSRKIDRIDNKSEKFYPLTRPSSIDSGINDTQSSNTLLSSSPESPPKPDKRVKKTQNTAKLSKSKKISLLKPHNLKTTQTTTASTHNLYRTKVISLCDNNCETTISSTVLSTSTYLCENCSLTICKQCKKRQKFGKTCHGIIQKTPIFGEKLDKLEKIDQNGVPSFIYYTIKSIEQTNIHRSEGFYRKTGSYKLKAEIKRAITTENCSKNEYPITNSDMLKDPHIYAQIFKDFFRELPKPIIPQKINVELCRIGEITDSVQKCSETRAILKLKLSRLEMKVFSDLIMHLARVSLAVQDNLMTAGNLAIIWVQCLMGFDEPTAENIGRLKIENEKLVSLLKFVIEVAAEDLRNKQIRNSKSGKVIQQSSDEISKLDSSFDNREHWMRKQVTPRRAKSLRVGTSTHL